MASILALPGWDDFKEVVLHHLDAEERQEAVLICKDFHNTICYLERHKRLNIDDSMEDRKVLDSIMSSSRRFKELAVNVSTYKASAERTIAVVEKFKRHMKKLTVYALPEPCSVEVFAALLNAATDVEDLDLSVDTWRHREWENHNFVPEKEFSKLRHLSIFNFHDISGILSRIPDNSLESLSICEHELRLSVRLSEEAFQTFVNRQTKLKKLYVPTHRNLNLDHLALEELFLHDEREDQKVAAILKHQPMLRRLRCETIGSAVFNELRKMRHLEVLKTEIVEEHAGELTNLTELVLAFDDFSPTNDILRRLVLPRLEKFVKTGAKRSSMDDEDFMTLSRSSHNLQHIDIQNWEIGFMPAIIEQFLKLKTLRAESMNESGDYHDANYFGPALSRQNLSLEEIVIDTRDLKPIGSLYDAINACPNLKRISLEGLKCTEQQVLNLVRSHPQLTHFRLHDTTTDYSLGSQLFSGYDNLHPLLIELINIFRASADFKQLSLENFGNYYHYDEYDDETDSFDWDAPRVEDLLTDDADQIIVEKSVEDDGLCTLKLVKKSQVRDPYKNFHEKKSYFEQMSIKSN